MISNNNTDSHNKIEKLEEKKKNKTKQYDLNSNDDVRDFIRQCVLQELQTINVKRPSTHKSKTCDCGKDITNFKPQQIKMDTRSKVHNENI